MRKTGVWFFSLDAASWLAVRAARWLGLPDYDARMTVETQGELVEYSSERTHKNVAPAEFSGRYTPTSQIYHVTPGSLDYWLTERYCLYAALNPDEIVYGGIHHAQWRLQPVDVDLRINTMTDQIGIELPKMKPICHFARLQEVVAWPIVALQRPESPT